MQQRWHEVGVGPRRDRSGGRVARALVAAAVAASATACGAQSTNRPVASGSGKSSTTTGAAGHVASGGVLRLGADTAPFSLNPALTNNDQWDAEYYQLAYEPLLQLEPSGQFAPGLATSWHYVGTGNREFELTLRKGVKFSDGSSVTAKDVAASLLYFKNAHGSHAVYAADIASVTTKGRYTVILHMSAPDPGIPLMLSQALLAGEIIGASGLKNPKSLGLTTDGAGPYMLDPKETVYGSKYTYIRNPNFWDPAAQHYKKVVINNIPTLSSDLAALRSGRIDFFPSNSQTSLAARADGESVVGGPAVFQGLYLFDRQGAIVPALGHVRVRQAMNYALNRKAIAKALYKGLAQPNDEISDPGTPGYVPQLERYYKYDPAKARQLLAAAGYPHGFSAVVLAGVNAKPLDEAIAQELAAVGIKVTLHIVATGPEYIKAALSRSYPIGAMYYGALPMYIEGEQLLIAKAGFFNPFKNANAGMLKLLSQAAVGSPSQSLTASKNLMAATVKQAWFVPVIASDITYVSNGKVGGITYGPSDAYADPALFYPKG